MQKCCKVTFSCYTWQALGQIYLGQDPISPLISFVSLTSFIDFSGFFNFITGITLIILIDDVDVKMNGDHWSQVPGTGSGTRSGSINVCWLVINILIDGSNPLSL